MACRIAVVGKGLVVVEGLFVGYHLEDAVAKDNLEENKPGVCNSLAIDMANKPSGDPNNSHVE